MQECSNTYRHKCLEFKFIVNNSSYSVSHSLVEKQFPVLFDKTLLCLQLNTYYMNSVLYGLIRYKHYDTY